MPGQIERKYWDACCFLDYVNGNPLHLPTLDALLAESEKGNIRIVTSTLPITEVAFGASEQKSRVLSNDVETSIDALWEDGSAIEVVEYHRAIAFKARDLIRAAMEQSWSLKPPDAIHLATAVIIGANEFHTYDAPLAKYAPLIRMPVIEPYTPQPRLPTL